MPEREHHSIDRKRSVDRGRTVRKRRSLGSRSRQDATNQILSLFPPKKTGTVILLRRWRNSTSRSCVRGSAMRSSEATPSILTLGHSTRTLEGLIRLLKAHGVELVVDVRTIPRSKRNPQFNQESLPDSLRTSGMDYVHLKELGGLRHPKVDSENKAWRNLSFRGFADYMQTAEFEAGLERLIILSQEKTVAVLCAEALPWRCHRSLIADALTVRGIPVEHIMTEKTRTKHVMTRWARIEGMKIAYPLDRTCLLRVDRPMAKDSLKQ